MKLRKFIVSIATLVCILALYVPAYAANVVELPTTPTAINNATQKGWLTDGVDGKSSDFTVEQFTTAKQLVLEFEEAPVGEMQFIWQGDGDGWAWNQTDGLSTTDTKIEIDLAATVKNYSAFQSSTQVKIFIAYYNDGFDDLKITKAYFVGGETGASDGAAAVAANPQTGDNFMIFIAIIALAVAAIGTYAFYRKAKAE